MCSLTQSINQSITRISELCKVNLAWCTVNVAVLWDVMPCSLVDTCQCFGATYFFLWIQE
jgi:hypothetical protein